MVSIDNQNPSTLDLLAVDDDDLRLSCRSIFSKERVEEHVRGGRVNGSEGRLIREIDGLFVGGGEKLDLGTGVMIPFRLGDLYICFPLTAPGSCSGNREVYLMSCIVFRCFTRFLMVGLSDGSI